MRAPREVSLMHIANLRAGSDQRYVKMADRHAYMVALAKKGNKQALEWLRKQTLKRQRLGKPSPNKVSAKDKRHAQIMRIVNRLIGLKAEARKKHHREYDMLIGWVEKLE